MKMKTRTTKDVPPDCSDRRDRLLVHRVRHRSKLHGPSTSDQSGLVGLCAGFKLMKKKKLRRINPVARALRSRALQPRVVRARKGRGSYRRKSTGEDKPWQKTT